MGFDIERARTDILRDAWSEVNSTIRAQDRKASYMIALVWFLISAFTMATIKINGLQTFSHLNELLLFFPIAFLITAAIYLFYSYYPQLDPVAALQDDDREFGKNKLFLLHLQDKEHNAKELAETFVKDTNDFEGTVRMLYIEIIKLSKIRERKIYYIKQSAIFLLIGVVAAFLQIITFFQISIILAPLSLLAPAWILLKKRKKK